MLKLGRALPIAIVLIVLVPGCTGKKIRQPVRRVSEKNILFNPDWTGLPAVDVMRAAWPSTDAYQPSGAEILDYQERLIDRQGLTFLDDDQYYRRFDSVRTGRRLR